MCLVLDSETAIYVNQNPLRNSFVSKAKIYIKRYNNFVLPRLWKNMFKSSVSCTFKLHPIQEAVRNLPKIHFFV